MDNFVVFVITGFLVGTFGTLIGAGGGFILVPLLLLTYPEMPPETITAVSIAVVAANAISGSIAYARSGRIDYKAGWKFGLFTVPGSVLGVFATRFIPQSVFQVVFGFLLLIIALSLFLNKKVQALTPAAGIAKKMRWKSHSLTDSKGQQFNYSYNQNYGIIISILVGFISPLLGIGGGIIHVPAMVHWLQFPVFIATATSHFILAIMSTVSVVVHIIKGSYGNPFVVKMVSGLVLGVVPGAQMGAYLSHKIPTRTVIKVMAVCLGLVGIRFLLQNLFHMV